MAENNESHQGGQPRVDVLEVPKKSILKTIISGLFRMILVLVLIAVAGYAFLNYTHTGREFLWEYENKSKETIRLLDEAAELCVYYTSCKGQPPASLSEVGGFLIRRPFRIPDNERLPSGKSVPHFFSMKDGFGHDIDFKVDPQTRTFILTSIGFLPIPGEQPGLFNISREVTY